MQMTKQEGCHKAVPSCFILIHRCRTDVKFRNTTSNPPETTVHSYYI